MSKVKNGGPISFKYGYCGPSTNEFLVVQDKKGDRTSIVDQHYFAPSPDTHQYLGHVVFRGTQMTLFAEIKRPKKNDPEGTIRMKNITLI